MKYQTTTVLILLVTSFTFFTFMPLPSFSNEDVPAQEQPDLMTISLKEQELKLRDLEERLDDLEQSTIELKTLKGQVQSFNSDRYHVGGFIDSVFDSSFSSTIQNKFFFREANVILLSSAEVTNRLNAFVGLYLSVLTGRDFSHPQPPFNYSPPFNQSDLPFDIGNKRILFGEYHFHDYLTLRVGKFTAPFGIINQEYFEPLLLQHDKPQALRSNVIFDDLPTGAQFYGTIPVKDHKVGYHAYVATFNSDRGDLGGGGRLFWSLPKDVLTFGVSNQTGGHDKNFYSTVGGDVKAKWKNFVLRSELIYNFYESQKDQFSFYVQPALSFFKDKLFLFAQTDYLDDQVGFSRLFDQDNNPLTPTLFDRIRKYEQTIGINYLPFPFLRNRLELTWNDYKGSTARLGGYNRDHFTLRASATLSF